MRRDGRARARRTAIVVFAVATAGCRGDASGGAASASAPAAKAGIVLDEARGVLLDGTRIADVPAGAASVPPLQAALRTKRDDWKKAHVGMDFPGHIEVQLPEETSCRDALTVLHACAEAGYRRVAVRLGDTIADIELLFREMASDFANPHLWFRDDGNVEVRDATCADAYDIVAPADLQQPLEDLFPLRTPQVAWMGCDPSVSFRAATVALPPMSPVIIGRYAPCVPRPPKIVPVEGASKQFSMKVALEKDPDVKTPLAEPETKKALAAVEDRLLGCYAAARKVDPDLAPRVELKVTFGSKGKPTSLIAYAMLEALSDCVRDEAAAMRLDPPPGRSTGSALPTAKVMLEFGPKTK